MQLRSTRPEGRHRASRDRRLVVRVAVAAATLGGTSLTLGFMAAGDAYALDSYYECEKYGGHNVVLLANHDGTTPIQHFPTIQQAIGAASSTPASNTGSGAGDTVIVCHGVYKEDITIPAGRDNLTVRSEDGPSQVTIVGTGTQPVVTIGNRGTSFGGPAEGFTITAVSAATDIVGIQVGVPGAQSPDNEDEQCTAAGSAVSTASGCDEAAPAYVTINNQIMDNVFTNFKVPSNAKITGIKLDNTINSVVQQNKFVNVISDHSTVGSFEGIVVGGTYATVSDDASAAGLEPGDSTNINTAVLQNAFKDVLQGANSNCGTATGIALNGFMLDAHVYNNKIQQLTNNSSMCKVTGIYSNAYGTLENEQTGTLAPTNANIDNNVIGQLAATINANSTGIMLIPTPADAKPKVESAPPTCVQQLGQQCNDGIPPSSYTVVQNEIQHVYTAVDDEAVLGANSFIRFNNFDDDVIGVKNGSTGATQANTALDATNNWWGCELGGYSAPPNSTLGNNHGCAALINTNGGKTSWAPPQTGHVAGTGASAGKNAGMSH